MILLRYSEICYIIFILAAENLVVGSLLNNIYSSNMTIFDLRKSTAPIAHPCGAFDTDHLAKVKVAE